MASAGDKIESWIEAACDDGWDPVKDGWDLLEIDDEESEPRLKADELKDIHKNLAAWRSPAEFRQVVRDVHKRCRSIEIPNNPCFKFLLDRWSLAEFVRHKPQ